MRRTVPAFALALGVALAGCPARPGDGAASSSCRPCVAAADCTDERCVQLVEDAVCVVTCTTDKDCATDDRCVPLVTSEGAHLSACVARDGSCGTIPDNTADGPDAGAPDAGSQECARYKDPNEANTCCRCSVGRTCAPNGCYGGWVCDTQSCSCRPAVPGCSAPPQPGDALHAGGAVTASVGPSGGTMNRLHFAVIGDTRPAVLNDSNHYPLDTITAIYSGVAAANPQPAFAVTTGDYVYASPSSNQSASQLDLYLSARAKLPGPMFPAMGNHECTGFTAGNCGPGIGSGETSNYKAFMTKMLGPLGEKKPYYKRRVDASDGSWTAKFVVVAPNSWTDAQGTWLEQALGENTTYTFLVRHEPTDSLPGAASAPGVAPSEAIAQRHPLTLALEGHSHTWFHRTGSKEVVIGNGGAPMTGSAVFGYTVVSQRPDGALVVTNYAASNAAPAQTFAVKPDGTPAY